LKKVISEHSYYFSIILWLSIFSSILISTISLSFFTVSKQEALAHTTLIKTRLLTNRNLTTSTANFSPQSTSSVQNTIRLTFLIYKNSAIGINNLSYPLDWKKSESQNQITFHPTEAISNNTDSLFQVHRVPTPASLEDFVGYDINDKRKAGFKLDDFMLTNVEGHQVYEITYTYKDVNFPKYIEFYTIVGQFGCIISYIEGPHRHYNHLDALKELTSVIQSTNGANEHDKPGLNTANRPNAVIVNPMTHTMYIANGNSDTVSVMNTKNNRILTNISLGLRDTPNDLSIDSDDNVLYVSNIGSNTVSVIDLLTNKVTSNTNVGRFPISISEDTNQGFVFTANRDSGTVSVIDTQNNALVHTITGQGKPYGVAVNPITHTLYVTNSNSSTISIIDYYRYRFVADQSFIQLTNKTVIVGESPTGIAINAITNRIYVSNEHSNTISVIDGKTNNVVKTILVGTGPFHLVVNPNTNMIYVANSDDNTISVIDGKTNNVVKTIIVGYSPWGLAIDPDTNMIYITNNEHNKIYIINGTTNSVTAGVSIKNNSGYLDCKPGGEILSNSYITYDLYTAVKCKANPTSGFMFSSWYSDLPHNIDTSAIRLNISRYGTLSANFAKIPVSPPVELPEKFYDTLWALFVALVLGPIAGWLIPYLADRSEKEKQLKYLRTYIHQIDDIYENNHKNKDECLQLLNQKRKDITALLEDGIVNDSSYGIVDSRISEYTDKVNNSSIPVKEKKEGSPI
jgi:YVTN family beta-propeller protein